MKLIRVLQGNEVLASMITSWCVNRSRVTHSKLLNASSQSSIADFVIHQDAIDDRKLFVSVVLIISNSTRISDNNLVA